MKHFLVNILWSDPYPKEHSYRIEANNIGLASYRGIKQFRKKNKGRRIKNITVKLLEYDNGTQTSI